MVWYKTSRVGQLCLSEVMDMNTVTITQKRMGNASKPRTYGLITNWFGLDSIGNQKKYCVTSQPQYGP